MPPVTPGRNSRFIAAAFKPFCSTKYGVTFPMMDKIEVNGGGRHEVYKALTPLADSRGYTGSTGGSSGRISKRIAQHTRGGGTDTLTLAEQGGSQITRIGLVVTQVSETVGEGFPLVVQRTQA